jgi:hypothetical protein
VKQSSNPHQENEEQKYLFYPTVSQNPIYNNAHKVLQKHDENKIFF